jgi:hypothetical protein
MRYNAEFADLVDVAALATADELPEQYRAVVDEGWTVDERGAWLLRGFLATYFGKAEAFSDVTGYEAAVNGRGIPGDGLSATELAGRGVAFARAALTRLGAEHPEHPPATAYVSIGVVGMDDDEAYVGDVTFVTAHDGEPPYLGEHATGNAVLAIGEGE